MNQTKPTVASLKKEIEVITKFPDQNPNPVLKISEAGKLLYTNQAGTFIKNQWGIELGDDVPIEIVSHSKLNDSSPLEMDIGNKIFSFHIVPVVEFGFVNLYATDITAARDNEHILGKLAMYFSSQVYESIFTGDLEVKIETKRKKLSIFFSDIKGFSQLTERLEPEVLTDLLTNYLTEMTKIAIKHGGTVDKYIGDAIVAFYGAPVPLERHEYQACLTALKMEKKLEIMRSQWASEGDWPELVHNIRHRIGLNSGEMVTGNMGSSMRMNYTMMGDTVNLAARLEPAAKHYGVYIVVAENTYKAVVDQFEWRLLDFLRVKGKKKTSKSI